jgi:hypothetical protein
MAVIRNPFAGQFVEDLRPLFEAGAMLGERLMPELVKLLDGPVQRIATQSITTHCPGRAGSRHERPTDRPWPDRGDSRDS